MTSQQPGISGSIAPIMNDPSLSVYALVPGAGWGMNLIAVELAPGNGYIGLLLFDAALEILAPPDTLPWRVITVEC